MADLGDELGRLGAVLAAAQAPVAAHWRPGLERAEIVSRLEADGVNPHPDLLVWYGWHDGTDTPSATDPAGWLLTSPENHLCLSLHVPTLAQASTQRAFDVSFNPEWKKHVGIEAYRPSWHPVLISSDGWHVCLDSDGSAGRPGTLFVFDPQAGDDPADPERFFPDLTELVATVADAYESGTVPPVDTWVEPEDLPPDVRRLVR
ncbi:hypothetical protein DDE18_06570 [Nocardioides gansuensis]|uniref:SMI1/KNR4 family protein n=1 Tax=Nocardioides gansuensis TaxID=2138300 RepID=A0A2T8FDZ8_9ACTN|nr:hypothetical protein [Nocardioides gansuensis]PVG83941.1 hypothetical protein DDE18_06570 [Nocardioides gansuensis]